MSTLRVAILADMLEEGWPSMDLVAEMLVDRLANEHSTRISATLVRPSMHRRFSGDRSGGIGFSADRMINRFVDYPGRARSLARDFDVFHIVDHSYAQLVHALPAARTLVTCHDLDTFRSVLEPAMEPRSVPFTLMTRRILSGLQKAAHIACDTEATRDGLVSLAGVAPSRTTVVHNGPHPSCTPVSEPAVDVEARRLLGPRRTIDLLHVGSTIARKRLDTLLHVFGKVRQGRPSVRLV